MGGFVTRVLVVVAACLLVVALSTLAGDAVGAVRFANDERIVRDLSTLREQRSLDVAVRNVGRRPRTIIVSVERFETSSGKAVDSLTGFFGSPVRKVVDANGAQTFSLPVELPTDAKPPKGRYSTVIVALDRLGGRPAERRLEVKVTDRQAPTEQGRALAANGFADTVLPAVNFVPSLLSPLGPTLIVAGVGLLILAGIFWRRLGRKGRPAISLIGFATLLAGYALGAYGPTTPGPVTVALFVLAVTVGLLCAVGSALPSEREPGLRRVLSGFRLQRALLAAASAILIAGGLFGTRAAKLDEQPGWHLIATKPLPLAADQSTGTVGVAADAEGNVAELRASSTALDAVGLVRAGTYIGTVDLRRDASGGDAKATVTVRDWWPWALLTVAAGVALGAWLRRHFEVRGPRGRAFARAARVLRDIRKADARWQTDPQAEPHVDYSLAGRAADRVRLIRALIGDGQTDVAAEHTDALERYAAAFERSRWRLSALVKLQGRLEKAHGERTFDVDAPHVESLRRAREILAGGTDLDLRDPDANVETLAQLNEEIELVARFVKETLDVHALIAGYVTDGERRSTPSSELGQHVQALRELGQKALIAPDVGELAKIRIQALETGLSAGLRSERATATAAGQEAANALARPQEESREPAKPGRPQEAAVEATIKAEVFRQSVWVPANRGYVGEEFRFTAELKGQQPVSVVWDLDELNFRDEQRIELPRVTRSVIHYRYNHRGDRDVKLRAAENEAELAVLRVAVQGAPVGKRVGARAVARDREMTFMAGLIAVASGVLALYFADNDWGQPKDYLEALLWGAATAEGLKLIADLASNRLVGKA